METSQPDVLQEKNAKAIYRIERVNLYDCGYEKAGSAKGDPEVFVSCLQRILNGDLVEEPYKGFSDEEKKERINQIKTLEKKVNQIQDLNSKAEAEIKEKEKDIDKYRKDLLNIRETRADDTEKLKRESFSLMKFSLNLFILVMLSVYLFFFYISATYKALYVDLEGIAERIVRGEGTGSIMPGPYELADALQYNYLLLVVPFVFYAFGWAFHVLLELRTNLRFIFLSLLIGVTFVVDFLLAMIISNNTESAKSLMGLVSFQWYQNPSFYVILFLGFLVYIIWSILLDSLIREWDKKEITDNLKKIINHLNGDCKVLKARMQDTSPLKKTITDYREDVSTVMYGNLKRYIDQFTSGWLTYLAPANLKDAKEKCLMLKKEFEDKNNIRSGLVKVVRKSSLLNAW